MGADSDVVGTMVNIDDVPLERLRSAGDGVLGEALRRFLATAERQRDEAAPRFTNFV